MIVLLCMSAASAAWLVKRFSEKHKKDKNGKQENRWNLD